MHFTSNEMAARTTPGLAPNFHLHLGIGLPTLIPNLLPNGVYAVPEVTMQVTTAVDA